MARYVKEGEGRESDLGINQRHSCCRTQRCGRDGFAAYFDSRSNFWTVR